MAARSVCVFCGARPGNDPIYMQEATAVGQMLVTEGWRLV
ncbi:MAG TPA: TIGR00730 family Rossman fold protein, partial [Sulfitobacter sp.]|nr:TIGR00730 family Rossman fold protein [Sulfitobacter sp.]